MVRAGTARIVLALALVGCRATPPETTKAPSSPAVKRPIDAVLADHTKTLMAVPGVVIVFVGALPDGTPCITVGVSEASDTVRRAIPPTLEGHPVVIQETGPLGPR